MNTGFQFCMISQTLHMQSHMDTFIRNATGILVLAQVLHRTYLWYRVSMWSINSDVWSFRGRYTWSTFHYYHLCLMHACIHQLLFLTVFQGVPVPPWWVLQIGVTKFWSPTSSSLMLVDRQWNPQQLNIPCLKKKMPASQTFSKRAHLDCHHSRCG